MQVLKKIVNFYINSSLHVALAVYSFIRITELYFDLTYNEPLDYFIFYGTITGYNFVKYAGVAKLYHISLTTHLRIIQVFSFVCFLLMFFYGFKLRLETLLFFAPFGLLTLFYAVPFLGGFQKNLRSVGYLKIIIVALVWTGISVFIPVFDRVIEFPSKIYLMAFQRFLLVVILILPFDIRDLKYDATSLQTIPRKIGVAKTKKLGCILLIFCLVIEFVIAPDAGFRTSFLIVSSILLVLLMSASEKQFKYYSSFLVESIPIIWWLMLLIS